jgi:hypothetical protein
MSAAEALRAARAAGVCVTADRESLVLEARTQPPASVLDGLAQHKAGVLTLLRPGRDGWSAEDWRAFFDERAGIAEFGGGLPRAEAEALAFDCCVVEWLNRNPAWSESGRCLQCRRGADPGNPLLPFGTEPGSHAWLHGACWPAWHRARRDEAIATLRAMGIET